MIEHVTEKIRTPLIAAVAGTAFNQLALWFSEDALRVLGGISYLIAILLGIIKLYRFLQSLKHHADSIEKISDEND